MAFHAAEGEEAWTEAASKTMKLDRNPALFRLITEYLRMSTNIPPFRLLNDAQMDM